MKGNWGFFALAGVLALSSVFAVCRATPGCLPRQEKNDSARVAEDTAENKMVVLESQGERDMSIQEKTYGDIVHANDASFQREVLKSDVPVLVDFYADWCGPCRALAPVLEEFAQENTGVKIVKVNVDDSPASARRYGISSIPSLLAFDGGEIVAEHVGMANKAHLKRLLAR